MRRIKLNNLIEVFLFLYVLSLYLFTFQPTLNLVSNMLAAGLMSLIWVNFLVFRKKIYFNSYLFLYLIFILISLISTFNAIDQGAAFNKLITLFLLFLLMFSLLNYINSFKKIKNTLLYFTVSGFIASIYILLSSDFSSIDRFGSELGNVNAVGMMIGISSIFCFYFLITSKYKYFFVLMLSVNIVVILLTGSRKALFFILLSILLVLFFRNKFQLIESIKTLIWTCIIFVITFYLVFTMPFFYEIIGKRIESLYNFAFGEGSDEASVNVRADMIEWGIEWFIENPLIGYGIDNYRYLYSSISGGLNTYSHNNLIELLVGIGIIGTAAFYFAYIIVIRNLYKAIVIMDLEGRTLGLSFIAIIVSYIVLSIGLIYYFDKHISIVVAIGSAFYSLIKRERTLENKLK